MLNNYLFQYMAQHYSKLLPLTKNTKHQRSETSYLHFMNPLLILSLLFLLQLAIQLLQEN